MRSHCTLLLKIYTEELARESVEDLDEGIQGRGRMIKAPLRFADDQAMIARSQGGLHCADDG